MIKFRRLLAACLPDRQVKNSLFPNHLYALHAVNSYDYCGKTNENFTNGLAIYAASPRSPSIPLINHIKFTAVIAGGATNGIRWNMGAIGIRTDRFLSNGMSFR